VDKSAETQADLFLTKNKETSYISLIDQQEYDDSTTNLMFNSSLNYLNEEFKATLGRDISKEDVEEKSRFSSAGIIDFHSTLNYNTFYRIPHFSQGSNYWLMNDFRNGAGNCGPTALTNAVWFFGWDMYKAGNHIQYRVKDQNTRLKKARLIHDTVAKGMVYFDCLGTFYSQLPNGLKHLFMEPAGQYYWNHRDLGNGFNGVYTGITEQCPIIVCLQSEALSGHFVTCIGRINSTGGAKYLVVLDGWNRYGRLVRDNYYWKVRGKKIWIRG